MINSHMQYNEIAKVGNPTRSPIINKLIQKVTRKETARRGAPSQKRRALFPTEFEQSMDHFEHMEQKEEGLFAGAFFRFQLHMAARGDDTAKARLADMKPFHQFEDYGVTMRLCWSKNVQEERDSPTQLLVGAMDHRYCVLTALALWLEHHFTLNENENDFLFAIFHATPEKFEIDMEGEDNPEKERALQEEACVDYIKGKAYDYLTSYFKDSEFVPVDDGKKGVHSIRKLALDIIRGAGLSKDDGDHRARWKGGDRQQDEYTSTTIPYVDAKAAFALCKGGACAYIPKEESGVTDGWILDHVVPNAKRHVPKQVAVVLGRALLWLICHEDEHSRDAYVPSYITERVFSAIHDLGESNTLDESENLIARQPLLCDGVDSELIIQPFLSDGEASGELGVDPRAQHAMHRQEIRMLTSHILHQRREITDMKAEGERMHKMQMSMMTKMNRNIIRLVNVPTNRHAMAATQLEMALEGTTTAATGTTAAPAADTNQATPLARLSTCPRTLHALWDEWEKGTTTQKPVRLWTAQERGKYKHSIYMRKFLWNKVSEMISGEIGAHAACDMIYEAYGESQPVTTILKKLKADSKTGGHPHLRTRCL